MTISLIEADLSYLKSNHQNLKNIINDIAKTHPDIMSRQDLALALTMNDSGLAWLEDSIEQSTSPKKKFWQFWK